MNDNYVLRIRRLIAYFNTYSNFSLCIVYKNVSDLQKELKLYKENNMRNGDEVYIQILERMAYPKTPADRQLFALTDNQQKKVYAYVNLLENVFNTYMVDRNEAIRMAWNAEGTRVSFSGAVERLKNGYCNAILYKEMYDDILCELSKKQKPVTKVKKSKTGENNIITNDSECNIFHKVYNSGLSLLDYAHTHFVDINCCKSYFRPDISGCCKEMADELYSRKINCIDELKEIIDLIINRKITILEYYKRTRINPAFLPRLAKDFKIIEGNNVSLNCFSNKYKDPHNEIRQIENLLTHSLIIDKEEVDTEFMKKIYQEMKDNNEPLKYSLFKDHIYEEKAKSRTLTNKKNK